MGCAARADEPRLVERRVFLVAMTRVRPTTDTDAAERAEAAFRSDDCVVKDGVSRFLSGAPAAAAFADSAEVRSRTRTSFCGASNRAVR